MLPILQKLKTAYKLWFEYYKILPKEHRYSLGQRIDNLLIEAIEATTAAAFLHKEKKIPYVQMAIRKIDTIKILTLILWENHSLDDKKYISLSEKINEVGKMLGGWNGQLIKTSSVKAP